MMHFSFVLVEPETPENVGAAARAIKTMGFGDLRIVAPRCEIHTGPARYLAHGSADILDRAQVFPTLIEALHDLDLVVGTVSVHRRVYKKFFSIHELPDQIERLKESAGSVAIVFGRESSGLTNDEIALCDLVTSVPMAVDFPSLNLAQAVMVYAFALSHRTTSKRADAFARIPREQVPDQFRATHSNVKETLGILGIPPSNRTWLKVLGLLPRMNFEDLQLVNYLCRQIQKSLGRQPHPRQESRATLEPTTQPMDDAESLQPEVETHRSTSAQATHHREGTVQSDL